MAITIYTKTDCPHCKSAKEEFQSRNVRYTEINVSENPDKIEELVRVAGVRKVPVIVEEGRVTVGYKGRG